MAARNPSLSTLQAEEAAFHGLQITHSEQKLGWASQTPLYRTCSLSFQ